MRRLSQTLLDLVDRFQESLFYVPALYLLLAAVLSAATSWLDGTYDAAIDELPFLIPTTVDSARAITTTVAAATITVAGIVLSITVVAVQLASSQFSPRVLRGYMRDPLQQNVMGVVVGTFTYSLVILSLTRVRVGGDAGVFRSISVTLTVALGVAAVLAILAFIDHSARNMQVGEIVRRIAAETTERIVALYPDDAAAGGETVDKPFPDGKSGTLRSLSDGWVQRIDIEGLLAALPEGCVARIDTRPGGFIGVESALVTVWPAPEHPDSLRDSVNRSFRIGRSRQMHQDPAFGIQQLVDIALRALSPGINDPTTAVEVIVHLGGVVREVLVRDLRPRIDASEGGTRLYRPHYLSRDDYVRLAFRDIRIAGSDQPPVIDALLEVIGGLVTFLGERDLASRSGQLEREARLALHAIRAESDLLDEDREQVMTVARRYGWLED